MAATAQRVWTPVQHPTGRKLGWQRCGLEVKMAEAIHEADMMQARGLIYEPRAFWSVATVNTETDANTNFLLNREHFHNGSRYPITLNRMIVAPLSYTFRDFGVEPPADETQFQNSCAIINLMQVMVSAPFRQHYSRKTFNTTGFGPLPTWEPAMRNDPTNPYASAPWGISHWDFDQPLLLPRLGSIEFSLTGITWPNVPGLAAPDPTNRPFVSMMWHEYGSLMSGSGRLRDREQLPDISAPTTGEDLAWLGGDAFGVVAPANVTPAWTATGAFTAHDFNQRNPVRTGSVLIRAFSVQLEQIAYDDALDAVGGVFNNQEVTPLSLRTACRVRTVDGGTQEWWWRPGAPLAMVMPTITPAQVFPLDPPITLGPGDTLDVEVRTPSSVANIGSPPQTMTPTYRFGVSFTGWAAIEG